MRAEQDISDRAYELLLMLEEQANYPMGLVRRLQARGEKLTPAGIYAHLARLHNMDLVQFHWSTGTPEKGGRSRKMYSVTGEGRRVLRQERALRRLSRRRRRGPSGQGADGLGADGLGADGLGADGLGADGLGADGLGADGLGADGLGADGLGIP